MQHDKEWLKITTANEIVKVAVDEIIYVIADGNYSDLYLVDGYMRKMTFQLHYFEEYFSRLRYNPFTRVGRSVLVNKDHIRMISIPERTITFGGHTVAKTIKPIKDLTKLGRDTLKDLKKELSEEREIL